MSDIEREKLLKFAKFQQKFGFPGVLITLCLTAIYSKIYAPEHVSLTFYVIGIYLVLALINYDFFNKFMKGEPTGLPLVEITCDKDTPYGLVVYVFICNAIWLYMLPIGLIWNILK